MDLVGNDFGFCAQTASIWQIVGKILLIFKTIIPVVLVVIGIIMLGKAVISSDEKDMKKCFNSMLKKFIVSVVIFFIPTIVSALFGVVEIFKVVEDDYKICERCISHPNSDMCEEKILAMEDAIK